MNLVRADHRGRVAFDVAAERTLQIGVPQMLGLRPRLQNLRISRHRIGTGARGVLTHDQVDARRWLNLADHCHQPLHIVQIRLRLHAKSLIVATEHDQINVGRNLRHGRFPLCLPLRIAVVEVSGCRTGGRQFGHPHAALIVAHPQAEQGWRAVHHFEPERPICRCRRVRQWHLLYAGTGELQGFPVLRWRPAIADLTGLTVAQIK